LGGDTNIMTLIIAALLSNAYLFHAVCLEDGVNLHGRWPLFGFEQRMDWWLTNDVRLHRVTRFDRAGFSELCRRLGIDVNDQNKRHFKYRPAHRLIIALSRMSHNCTLWEMSEKFQLSAQRVEEDFFDFVARIIAALDDPTSDCNIRWFTDAEAAAHQLNPRFPEWPDVWAFADGLFVRMLKPKRHASLWWSIYKKHYGVIFVIIVDWRGRIRFVSEGFQPTIDELKVMDYTQVSRKLASLSFPRDLMGMGDTTYAARPSMFYAPYAVNQMQNDGIATQAQKVIFNLKLRNVRVLSEHVNSQITSRWAILKEVSRLRRSHLPDLMKCACLLANFQFVFTGVYPIGVAG
jgi:hypothetical protein